MSESLIFGLADFTDVARHFAIQRYHALNRHIIVGFIAEYRRGGVRFGVRALDERASACGPRFLVKIHQEP